MRLGVFLIVSLIAVLGYAAFNYWATSMAEEAIAQAPVLPESTISANREAACERATEYYDQLFEKEPRNGNYELHENQLDAAQAQVDRACGS